MVPIPLLSFMYQRRQPAARLSQVFDERGHKVRVKEREGERIIYPAGCYSGTSSVEDLRGTHLP